MLPATSTIAMISPTTGRTIWNVHTSLFARSASIAGSAMPELMAAMPTMPMPLHNRSSAPQMIPMIASTVTDVGRPPAVATFGDA
jgi:hypothetical protein